MQGFFTMIGNFFRNLFKKKQTVAVQPTTTQPVPAPVVTPVPPPFPIPPEWPKGVELVDEVNGLVSIDPVRYNNPDCSGQLFCVEPTLAFVEAGSQADFTIRLNVAEAISAENGLGFHPLVRPVVATGDNRKYVYAPVVVGAVDRVPYIPNAWTITGGTFEDVLAKVSSGNWHKPTNNGPNHDGFVPK